MYGNSRFFPVFLFHCIQFPELFRPLNSKNQVQIPDIHRWQQLCRDLYETEVVLGRQLTINAGNKN
jgi:hypothetical protein